MTKNLNQLAKEIAEDEIGDVEISIAQIKEVLAVLGRRWRGDVWRNEKGDELTNADALEEINAIVQKAGK